MKIILDFIKNTRMISRVILIFGLFSMCGMISAGENLWRALISGSLVLFVPIIIIELTSNPIIHKNNNRCKFLLFLYNLKLISKFLIWLWLVGLGTSVENLSDLAFVLLISTLVFLLPAIIIERKYNPVFGRVGDKKNNVYKCDCVYEYKSPITTDRIGNNVAVNEYKLKEIEDFECVVDDEVDEDELEKIDAMDGYEFEYYCADLLERNNFEDVHVTKGSGDQGVDIIATKSGIKYAIQCKHYLNPVGNKPIQEIYTGKEFYKCHIGVVMTNSTFTKYAIDLAKETRILLWDRSKLEVFIDEAKH